jgi:hypothetical protein
LKKYFCEISKFGCQTPLSECYRCKGYTTSPRKSSLTTE